jgi:hypothetical protein
MTHNLRPMRAQYEEEAMLQDTPTIHRITKHAGIAGQYAITADVEYPGEGRSRLEFVGFADGGPIVMRTPMGETFVTNPGRFGEFGTDWVRRFLA